MPPKGFLTYPSSFFSGEIVEDYFRGKRLKRRTAQDVKPLLFEQSSEKLI
jgi:hypothetical protein